MRQCLRLLRLGSVVFFAIGLAACGEDPPPPGGNPDAAPPDPDSGVVDPPPPATGFQVVTPEHTLAPGEESTWCYYTHLPNPAEVGVKRWESTMTPGSHHLIVYTTRQPLHPDGTLTQDCGGAGVGGGLDAPIWTYASQESHQEQVMPDGIGMTVAAGQPAFIQMHYLNATDEELKVHVTLNAHTYGAGEEYVKAAAYVTYNTQIRVPRDQAASAEGSCAVPPDARFFAVSTHAHRFSTHTEVRDGGSMVFQSSDWEHPGQKTWGADPFFRFSSGKLTYHCDYFQSEYDLVVEGPSAQTNEMCMAVGYFFPADGPKFCVDSTLLPR